jgi:lysozyme family protein
LYALTKSPCLKTLLFYLHNLSAINPTHTSTDKPPLGGFFFGKTTVQYAYEALEAEYSAQIARAHIRPECDHLLEISCDRLLHDKPVYQRLFEATGVPAAGLMALAEREMSGNLHCYLGNGQRLAKRTTIVPINRGPFPDTEEGFIAGALDALHLDGLDQVARTPGGWTLPRFAYESEHWNGWGYRAPRIRIPSPYPFGGTTVQQPGKFIRDHVYSPTLMDPQLGTIAIVEKLFELDPSLKFGDPIAKVDDTTPIVQALHPVIGEGNIGWVQTSLNKLHIAGTSLAVDGNCGRGTRAAVRAFQLTHRLVVDGLPGPKTVGAISEALAIAGL